MILNWKHTENNQTTVVQIPVKVAKSVNKDYGIGGNLICNECKNQVSQKYVCPCGMEYTIGEIEYRKDKMTDIQYKDQDKKTFMEMKIDENITVEQEIKAEDMIDNFSYIDGEHYELYNNEDNKASDTLAKMHNFLHKKKIVLLVAWGYNGKQKAGVIISEKDRLLLAELRDYNLIKETKHLDIKPRISGIEEKLKAITESRIPELYKEFLETVESGKAITKPKVEKEEKPIVTEVDFLQGF
jgi:hypothetical protein